MQQLNSQTKDIIPAERERVVCGLDDTARESPDEQLVHELFEQQARRTPNVIAVMHGDDAITYSEINRRANKLASHLKSKGVGPEQLVGICLERSVEMVVALLAILKAGGAYMPLDPNYPTDRLAYMLKDAQPRIVLTQRGLCANLHTAVSEVLSLDAEADQIEKRPEEDRLRTKLDVSSRNLVYVIYTSGSTGSPKGTAMTHGSMVNLIGWHRSHVCTTEGTRVLQFAALSFDVAFQEIFSTLCSGGTLVLLDEWVRRDAQALAQFLHAQSIERVFVPPLVLQSLAEYFDSTGDNLPEFLQDVIAAGEQLRISRQVLGLFKGMGRCRLHNHYGPTETHVVTSLTLSGTVEQWPTLPPIGRPISNTQIYVLDRQWQPVPTGVPGEIYIGGEGVARGYMRRPGLTAERFIGDPFSGNPKARLYRTGDLGRWRDDGSLEYLGRNDDQVKVRGYRIELGEVEAELVRSPRVKAAAVLARENEHGERRLVAYIVAEPRFALTAAEIRSHLRAVLPEYMVPSGYVFLHSLPLTPNGKLDRKRLPTLEFVLHADAVEETDVLQGEVEELLGNIWRELLHVDKVGRQDDFFALGGDSVAAMRLVLRVKEKLGVQVYAHAVFRNPTIGTFARVVRPLLGCRC